MDNILEQIHKSALKFLVPLNLDQTYSIILHEAIKLVNADGGAIHMMTDGEFKVAYASRKELYEIKPRKSANVYQTFTTQRAIISHSSSVVRAHKQLHRQGIRSFIFIPLSNRHQAIGVLALHSQKNKTFTKKELEVLKLFGSLASLAIRKNQLYTETNEALKARDLFISMAAHELRTPLTTISGYAQLLKSKLAGTDSSESRWVAEMSYETLRLGYLVNELLEVDRIKTRKFDYHFKEFQLTKIIHRAVSDFKFTHPEHNVEIKNHLQDENDVIVGDFDKLLQVLINLLDNAAKFSPLGSTIEISLKSQRGFIVMTVTDHGKGIPKAELPRVYEQFYQGGHGHEGMGIGLFLVKNILEKHHGVIKIKSKEGKGTSIEVKLPQAEI